MALKPLQEQFFEDESAARLMVYLKEWAAQITDVPLLDGVLLEDIDVSTTATWFTHGLGRTPRGWIVVKKEATVDIWQTGSSTSRIQLDADASATVSIWVF